MISAKLQEMLIFDNDFDRTFAVNNIWLALQ
jgi:hypothetical protein